MQFFRQFFMMALIKATLFHCEMCNTTCETAKEIQSEQIERLLSEDGIFRTEFPAGLNENPMTQNAESNFTEYQPMEHVLTEQKQPQDRQLSDALKEMETITLEKDEQIDFHEKESTKSDTLSCNKQCFSKFEKIIEESNTILGQNRLKLENLLRSLGSCCDGLEDKTKKTGNSEHELREMLRTLEKYKESLAKLSDQLIRMLNMNEKLTQFLMNTMNQIAREYAKDLKVLEADAKKQIKSLDEEVKEFTTKNLKLENLYELAKAESNIFKQESKQLKKDIAQVESEVEECVRWMEE